jgi:hypothetical protein
LLCPFCGNMFPQDKSPLIIGGAGEKITGPSADTGPAEGM